MNIIFQISGGAGKCVAATAVCAAIKKQYPDSQLIVISAYPDVFINNPNVDKNFAFGTTQYFYKDYIEGKEFKSFVHDPYWETSFLEQNTHLIKVWCEMFGITYNGELPEIFLTKREVDYYQRTVTFEKPIFLLQTNGGGDANLKYSWARDIPQKTAIEIVEHFKNEYSIFHVKREDQLAIPNTYSLTAPIRQLIGIAMLSEKRLLIDSMLQHICAAISMQSVVCWIANKPQVFGYNLHTNIVANKFTQKPDLRNSFLTEFNIGGALIEFPYNDESEIFNTDKIIEALSE